MDDQLLLGESQEKVDREMATFRALGVDRLRVSAFWNQLAPAPLSRTKPPGFNAKDPNDPRYGWAPLDRVVGSAARHGLRVMVSVSMPAPIWATGATRRPNPLWKPSVAEFADFTEAVVRRYASLVDHYGISNEPNQGVWLQPQSDRRGLFAPHHYRNMVLASYPRIKAFDPDSVALVGELASSGRKGRGATVNIRPLLFLREMACRDRRYRRIRRGRCANFRPIPVDAIGHHPYQLLLSPFHRSTNRYDAAINDGRKLVRVLDRLTRLGSLKPGRGRRLARLLHGVRLPDQSARPVRRRVARHPAAVPAAGRIRGLAHAARPQHQPVPAHRRRPHRRRHPARSRSSSRGCSSATAAASRPSTCSRTRS